MTTEAEPVLSNLELARAFVGGRSLKRADTISMVKELLERLETAPASPPADTTELLPNLAGPCHIPIEVTSQGAIAIEGLRFLTQDQALVFADKIVRTVAEARK